MTHLKIDPCQGSHWARGASHASRSRPVDSTTASQARRPAWASIGNGMVHGNARARLPTLRILSRARPRPRIWRALHSAFFDHCVHTLRKACHSCGPQTLAGLGDFAVLHDQPLQQAFIHLRLVHLSWLTGLSWLWLATPLKLCPMMEYRGGLPQPAPLRVSPPGAKAGGGCLAINAPQIP